MRVLIAVTHLLGAGHLTRAAAIARAFAAAGHEAVLVSGGAPAPLVRLDAVRLVQLPPLRADGLDFTRLLGADGRPADAALLESRRRALVELVDGLAPDALLTELHPFGRRALSGEFDALIAAVRHKNPAAVVAASVRDVLVAPDRPEKVARAHARIAQDFDAVLVHGDPDLLPLDASWPLEGPTRAKIRYTGYVDEGSPCGGAERAGILVAAGSSAAGIGLFRAAAEAARRRPDLGWRILAGHGVPDADLAAIAGGLPPAVIGRARPDYRALLAASAVSISQCGYNTAVDLLATGTLAILVPFEAGRETEQRLRAERLAARGLARVLPETELTPETLLAAVEATLSAGGNAPGGAAIDLGGAARTVAIVRDLVGRRARPPIRPAPEEPGFARLRAALDGAVAAGRRIALWWRDDDAVADTAALARLLALADAHGIPPLIAAIPARIEPSLGRRIEATPGVSLAVHGLAHADHAPAGEKRAEFGPHRPLASLAADAAAGLRIARDRLPEERLLPVFVPPWNRIAPDLAQALPRLGYRGLSAWSAPAVPGLATADATFDPIDWRGTRSLRDPQGLLADLAEHVDYRPGRPIGLLTHHLAHDRAIWVFLDRLLPILARHPAVAILDPQKIFAPDISPPALDLDRTLPSLRAPEPARVG